MRSILVRIRGNMSYQAFITILVVLVFYMTGIAGMTLPSTRSLFFRLIPSVILGSFLLSLIFHRSGFNSITIIVFTIIACLAWLIEVAGVKSGIIFGQYTYGPSLGIQVAGVPLIIGLNWLFLVYCTAAIVEKMSSGISKIFWASILMVVYDVVLELSASSAGMWEFSSGIPPLRNYASWFIVSFILHLILRISGVRIVNIVAPFVFLIQFLFFLALPVFLKN